MGSQPPPASPYVLDPADPRAPTDAQWSAMTEAQRARVVAELPAEVPFELCPPEGDAHRIPKTRAVDALDRFFKRIGRQVYVSSELATYYPGEPRFAPDVLAVMDVPVHERMKWVVADEGKGLDFVLEVFVRGEFRKDFVGNVERYGRLGIPEYFVFDRPGARLLGHRLGTKGYQRIVPQAGRYESRVLGLELAVERGLVRFLYGGAPVPELDELVERLEGSLNEVIAARDEAERRAEAETRRAEEESRRAEGESRRAEEESRRAEEEGRRAQDLQQRNAELMAELERLRRERGA